MFKKIPNKLFLYKLFVVLFIAISAYPFPVVAQEESDSEAAATEEQEEDYSSDIDDLQSEIAKLEKKLGETRNRAATLESQIAYMNNQIYLTTLNIRETEAKIEAKKAELGELVTDIGDLEERLERLDESISHHQYVYQARVTEFYKSNRLSTWELIFGSQSLTDAFLRIKYLKVLEEADRRLMEQMERTVDSYEEQKALLENKKVQVENVKAAIEAEKAELESRRAQLNDQKAAKDKLLAETQNDEQRYQELLSEAKAQLAAIRALVASRGGASLLSNQTVCDHWGCYYNQRDSAWGTYKLGDSEYSVAGYGCLISSVAMIATHEGFDITPADIAVVSSAFVPGWGYLYFGDSIDPVDIGDLAFYRVLGSLDSGPVIARLSLPEGTHFIVVKEKTSGGDYLIHDPWFEGAHDVLLSDYYSVSNISRVDKVVFQ